MWALSFLKSLAGQTQASVQSEQLLTGSELLAFLRIRRGREFCVTSCIRVFSAEPKHHRGRKSLPIRIVWKDSGKYLLTFRGEWLEATGPSGQSRLLGHQRFLEVFGQSFFRFPQATGRQVGLGPLFDTEESFIDFL